MSGLMRKLIRPAKKRLFDYFKEVEKFMASSLNEKELEDEEAMIEEYLECIINNVSIIEKCNREWPVLLREISGKQKITEEEHTQAAEGPTGYVEALIAASEVIGHLKRRLKRVK